MKLVTLVLFAGKAQGFSFVKTFLCSVELLHIGNRRIAGGSHSGTPIAIALLQGGGSKALLH